MQKLFHQYMTLYSRLRSAEINTTDIANTLGIKEETARVVISRMLDEYMIHSPSKGVYKIVKPDLWIALNGLASSGYISKVDELIRDLVKESEHIKAIMLYGSRPRGDYRMESDWDILILSDTPLPHIKKKYDYPLSVEVQPIEVYDKIFVREAINEGQIIYCDGEQKLIKEVMGNEITKKDVEAKLGEIQKVLFQLDDEKLFDSLSVKDIAYILYSTLRSMEYVEKNVTVKKELKIKPKIIVGAKKLYSAAKSGAPIVPDITRKELNELKKALIDKWSYLKATVR